MEKQGGIAILTVIIAVGVLTTIAFLILRVTKGGLPAMYCKAGASLCFIGTAFAAFSYSRNHFEYSVMMILGLIFSLLGDIWLDLKYVYDKDKDIFLYSGFICFMCGHVFFVSAIAYEYFGYKLWHFLLGSACCVLVAIGVMLTEKPMKLNYGKFRKIVVIYTFFVSMTTATSIIGMCCNGFTGKYILLSIGSVAFLLSDLVLSSIYFGDNKNTKSNVIINHILYYFAQFALAATILL